ncbi:predicted protein [Thalassiosira pseudonana CCMP1335]|uniref:Uncharacterized protein n=1 Tax=Thalassiosira pseudonana TaxID=35128 RepID=B8LE97_THAPS|nr:predicted protein [Thalassiosira pseudonana CCMP1335]EED86337.1 predicted protein [Thalassiosira pseudonana CCMP1335]
MSQSTNPAVQRALRSANSPSFLPAESKYRMSLRMMKPKIIFGLSYENTFRCLQIFVGAPELVHLLQQSTHCTTSFMNDGATSKATIPSVLTNDDPSLSQEHRDLCLAITLQQQENVTVYDAHKKRHEANIAANTNRTSRSNVQTRLAQVGRKAALSGIRCSWEGYRCGNLEYGLVAFSAEFGSWRVCLLVNNCSN